MNWFDYPICVPFNNLNYDVQYGGSHDLDVATPPNTTITTLLPGTIASITSPTWGIQVGIHLDSPYHNIPYMAYLHLSAVRPGLSIGEHVNAGDTLGWSGGCTNASQYAGTSNPTGHNFLDTPDQSSQPQTGIALMYGPEYGVGAGWTPQPDPALDPTQILTTTRSQPFRLKSAADCWHSTAHLFGGTSPNYMSGIALAWQQLYSAGKKPGPPLTPEYGSVNWSGKAIRVQEFANTRCEWDGQAHWYPQL